jgi:hypothetical protein
MQAEMAGSVRGSSKQRGEPTVLVALGDAGTYGLLRHLLLDNGQAAQAIVLRRPDPDGVDVCMTLAERMDEAIADAEVQGRQVEVVVFDATTSSTEARLAAHEAFEHEAVAEATDVVMLWAGAAPDGQVREMPAEVISQMRFADRIILSGRSTLGQAQVHNITATIRNVNSDAPIHWAEDLRAAANHAADAAAGQMESSPAGKQLDPLSRLLVV